MRRFIESVGARGLVVIIGMTLFLLSASNLAFERNNPEAGVLWLLVMGLLATGGYLWWLLVSTLEDTLDEYLDSECADAWVEGFRAHRDGLPCVHGYHKGDHHWETGTCPNPYIKQIDYEGRGRD